MDVKHQSIKEIIRNRYLKQDRQCKRNGSNKNKQKKHTHIHKTKYLETRTHNQMLRELDGIGLKHSSLNYCDQTKSL